MYNISINVVSLMDGTNTGVERIAVAAKTGTPTPIDMIWINGNNYKNMSQMDLLYGAAESPFAVRSARTGSAQPLTSCRE